MSYGPPPSSVPGARPKPVRRRSRGIAAITLALGIAAAGLYALFVAPAPLPPEEPQDATGAKSARPSATPQSSLVSYAIARRDIEGLSPSTPPGSRVSIWVWWPPKRNVRARVELVTDAAVVDSIVPPLIPNAPDTALLLVPRAELAELARADRRGSLSLAPPKE